MTGTQVTAITVDAIPGDLRGLPLWLCWRLVHKPGEPKLTKVPINAKNGQLASSTDSTTWCSFAEALAAHLSGPGDGVGFVFTENDPYVGVDLEGCYDPYSGTLASWAQNIVVGLSSYTEFSPSQTGPHIILTGELPEGRRRKGSIELYSEGRYFTMTGKLLDEKLCDVAPLTKELSLVHHGVFKTNGSEVNSFPLTDAGNAELFAHLYGNQLRYDHARGRWLIWERHRWATDVGGEIYRLAKEAARTRYLAALDIEDLDFRKKVSEFAVRSESRQKLGACLALAKSEHPIADAGFDWDTNSFLMGVDNGVVDLRTGEICPGVQEDRITMRVPVVHFLSALDPRCPRIAAIG